MTQADQSGIVERARELAGLDRIDYADCFSIAVSEKRSPEQWIREAVHAMPTLFSAVRVAHRALGLHLAGATSPEHVIGWDVLRSDAEHAVLGNAGMLGRPRIVVLAPQRQVTIATLLELWPHRSYRVDRCRAGSSGGGAVHRVQAAGARRT